MPPTPQYRWPLLDARTGVETWLKHENHTPAGAFKVRGGIVYFDALARAAPRVAGVVAATRGNHGQSVGLAARRHGIPAAIVVPSGNSREKNAAMRAQGVELIEAGDDFQASVEVADAIAVERGWHRLPSFHALLVAGIGSYALELFEAVPGLDTVYVPVGLGSGACGVLAARDALGLDTEVVGDPRQRQRRPDGVGAGLVGADRDEVEHGQGGCSGHPRVNGCGQAPIPDADGRRPPMGPAPVGQAWCGDAVVRWIRERRSRSSRR